MQPPSNHSDQSPTTAHQAAALERLAIDHAAFFAQWAEWATAHLASLLNALDPSSPPDARSELLGIEVADSLIPAAGWGDWALGYALAVADATHVQVPDPVRLAAEVLHGWAAEVGQGLDEPDAGDA
jgi:hypothetical protein